MSKSRKHGVMNVRPTSNCKYTNAKGGDTDFSHTPRLKQFPPESLRKGDSPLGSDEITSMAVPPSHGHGDSIKMHSVDELVQQSQQNAQQGSKQIVSISQPNVPVEEHVDRTNQSESLINKQVPSSPGTRLHRPFVPHAMHGSTLRESSMSKAEVASPLHALVRKSSTLSVQHQGESQQQHTRFTTADQAQRLQSVVPEKKLQISQQPMTHRINDDCRMIMGDGSPQKFHDSVCQPPSGSDGKLNNRQSIATVGQPTTQHDITCSYTDAKLQAEEKHQLQQQQNHQTQQRQQYVNRQGQSAVDEVQNSQKIYQQMRDNMIRQRQMQQRVLSQQQQMMIRASQRSHLSQTPIPYHGMMMQQRGIRDHTSQIRPHNAWVNNHQVIVASPNVNNLSEPCRTVDATMDEKSKPPNDALRYENYKMDNRNPNRIPQQYSMSQQERDAPMWNSKAPAIYSSQQSQSQQPQPQKKYEPVSKELMQHFGQHRIREPQSTKKKYAEFTPAMLRDQEQLVQNMRQQRIPENIMRRQFDALLDEQRRYLAFLNQVESAEMKNDALLSRNAKISIKDQRPDWMANITPARVTVQQVQRSPSGEDFRLYQRQTDSSKCNAGPPASSVHTNGGFHQSISSPQAVLSWPQRGNTSPIDPMHGLNNQRCDIPVQLHHQELKEQKCKQQQPLYEQYEQHRQNGEPLCNNLKTCEQQRKPNVQRDNPSSSLKLRHKKYIRPQAQNNGLQGMETVQEMLKTFESSKFGKSWGHTMDMGNRMTFKFNGIQDPSELEKLPQPPVEYLEKIKQSERLKISANGLCNTRNADNPASPPKRLVDETARKNRSLLEEYPRQCHPGEKLGAKIKHGNSNVIAKEENGRIASTVRQENHDILFQDYGQAVSRGQHPLQLMTIPSHEGNPIASQSNVPVIPYKFNASWPQYQRNMEQFYRNQRNLKMFAKNYTTNGPISTAQIPWTGTESKTMTDFDRNKQELAPVVQSAATTEQPSMFTHDAQQCDASILANNMACNNGQPEIRQPRIIGGLRYLARKVDYIQNPSLIAPNSFITSKFVQPLVSFN